MKWLFILLALANLAFWGYTRLEEPPKPVDWKARQINADKLAIVPIEAPQPAGAPALQANAASPAPTDDSHAADKDSAAKGADKTAAKSDTADKPADSKAEAQAAAKPDSKDDKKADKKTDSKADAKSDSKTDSKPDNKSKPTLVCYAWHGILSEDMPNVRKKLAALGVGGDVKVVSPDSDAKVRYWVYIPPRESNADAQRKADELKSLNVTDYFVVNDGGKWQNAISLGLFANRDAADRRLASVKELGVRSAVMHPRNEGVVGETLMLRHVPKDAKSALTNAANAFRGSSVAEADCS